MKTRKFNGIIILISILIFSFALNASANKRKVKAEVYVDASKLIAIPSLTQELLNSTKKFQKHLDLEVNYFTNKGAQKAIQQLCAKNVTQDNAWIDFMVCQYRPNGNLKNCAAQTKIDFNKIQTCVKKGKGKKLLKASIKKAKRKRFKGWSIYFNNKRYTGSWDLNSIELAACKSIRGKEPGFCKKLIKQADQKRKRLNVDVYVDASKFRVGPMAQKLAKMSKKYTKKINLEVNYFTNKGAQKAKQQLCAKKVGTGDNWINFMFCQYGGSNNLKNCAQKAKIPYDKIQTCLNDGTGKILLNRSIKKAKQKKFKGWSIYFNNKRYTGSWNLRSVERGACKSIHGKKPGFCKKILRNKK